MENFSSGVTRNMNWLWRSRKKSSEATTQTPSNTRDFGTASSPAFRLRYPRYWPATKYACHARMLNVPRLIQDKRRKQKKDAVHRKNVAKRRLIQQQRSGDERLDRVCSRKGGVIEKHRSA